MKKVRTISEFVSSLSGLLNGVNATSVGAIFFATPCFCHFLTRNAMEDPLMPEFILAANLALKLDLEPSDLPQFEQDEILKPVVKNGNTYYSAHDFYRLKGVLHLMREKGLSTDEALDRVQNWNWFTQTVGAH